MRRLVATSISLLMLIALFAPAALARAGHDGGQGTYGVADDKVVTKAGFIVIIFFPLVILLLSLLQNALDKRKARRKKHLPARDWAGGW
jgi:preprotein translocase subunit SecG